MGSGDHRVATVGVDASAGGVDALERALREARDRLQSMIRDYETALEELNGELQIVNGELSRKVDALDHQRLLISELNHRVKNILAVVIGVTRQTARDAASIPEFTSALTARFESMARSYELLSKENWTEAKVERLARQELAPFGPERVRLRGPDVTLAPKQALSLGMVLHELATNASKYGALAAAGGCVEVSWSLKPGQPAARLNLSWREKNGPAIEAPPARGFGLTLIERETTYGLDGAAQLEWAADGLRAELSLPVRRP